MGSEMCIRDRCKATAIYLNHKGQNHYNVVEGVSKENIDGSSSLTSMSEENTEFFTVNKPNQNDVLNKGKKNSKRISGNLNSLQKRRQSLREKYREDESFREKKLKAAFERYMNDEEFRDHMKVTDRARYRNNSAYRLNKKRNAIDKYATNTCLLYTSPSPRDLSTSRMPSSA